MKKKPSFRDFAIILIAAVPSIYLAITWPSIPAIIPVHYNIRFEPDKMGNKNNLWFVTGLMFVVSMLVYLLLKNIHRIDPKRHKPESQGAFIRLGIGCVVFISGLCLLIIIASTKNIKLLDYIFIPFLGLMFSFLGNYMNNIKPNYFAGFRLPWTLESESNWKKTHHLAARLWFWGGLVIIIMGVLLPVMISVFIMFGLLMIMTIIPIVYSYKKFKQEKTPGAL